MGFFFEDSTSTSSRTEYTVHSTPGYGLREPLLEQVNHASNVAVDIPERCKINNLENLTSLIWKSTELF